MPRATSVLTVLVAGLVGCQGKAAPSPEETPPARVEPESSPSPAPEAEAEPPSPVPNDAAPRRRGPDPKVVMPLEVGVTLVDPGVEPRAELRLHPEVGDVQEVDLDMRMKVALELGTQAVPPTPIPDIRVRLRTEVAAAPKGGDIRYDFRTVDVERSDVEGGSARMLKAVDQAVTGMRSTTGSFTVDRQGRTTDVTMKLPDLDSPGLRPSLAGFHQSFSQLFPVLPAEAVGSGARWRAVSRFEQSGIPIQQEADYRLVERDGDRLTISVRLQQAATRETEGPDLPDGHMDVLGYAADGKGKLTVDLAHVAPTHAESESISTTRSQIDMGGAPQSVRMELELVLSIDEVAAP